MGRPYGGCAIFINKTLGYNSIFVETGKILVFALFFQNMIQLLLFLFVYICQTILIVIYMSTARF